VVGSKARPGAGEWTALPPLQTDLGDKLRVGVNAVQNTANSYTATLERLIIMPQR
jgi:hypothetical protein